VNSIEIAGVREAKDVGRDKLVDRAQHLFIGASGYINPIPGRKSKIKGNLWRCAEQKLCIAKLCIVARQVPETIVFSNHSRDVRFGRGIFLRRPSKVAAGERAVNQVFQGRELTIAVQ
jgi:hypothetical protein